MKLIYIVHVDTNVPNDRIGGVDASLARHVWHGFRERAKVHRLQANGEVLKVLYDPVLDDRNAPEGYIPIYERDSNGS